MLDKTAAHFAPEDAFEFTGSWREFAPVAFTNLLLTLVTLGFYRFWATARERRYLWERTRFLGEPLEWGGTGKEMFFGFLIAMLLFVPIIAFLQFGMQALILRGAPRAAAIGGLIAVLALLYLIGVARFRALRYRLSRTYWRGIRGGSHDGGWRFGASFVWKFAIGFLAFAMLVPWAMTSLWRERWSRMSFGSMPLSFEKTPIGGILGIYVAAFFIPLLLLALGGSALLNGTLTGSRYNFGYAMIALFAAYLLFGLLSLAYYSAFLSKMVGEMRLSNLEFEFTATAGDWLKLIFGHIGLVIVTFGLGYLFLGYRNWSFFVRHMSATGEIDAGALAQSTTPLRTDAEGFADAFDVGAI